MSNQKHVEELIQLFTDDYYEKLFYFCLKKVSNTNEAEDLTADIALNIIYELRKGTTPNNFSAWVWKIAKNKYSLWADNKHKKINSFSGDDINDLEISDPYDLNDDLILQEDIKLLRRELAFISSEYRNVIVAYYIEYRKINDIAASLNLPIGTVKAKLFRSRNILKEGINMAREFGTLSYKPENIGFVMNGMSGREGEPWSLIRRKLYKNILIAAYRTPSTADELAVEIGLALPYMEDELEHLTCNELLRKKGKKYETNVFIVSAKAQENVYAHLKTITPALTEKIIALIENQVKGFEENGCQWHEGYQLYDDMKWAILMQKVDEISHGVLADINKGTNCSEKLNVGKWGHTKRPNGGEWDLLGLEEYNGEKPDFVGQHGCVESPEKMNLEYIDFGQFKFKYKEIQHKTPVHLTHEQVLALVAAAKQNTDTTPQRVLDELTGYGYLEKTDSSYKPTFRVTFKEKIGKMTAEQSERHDRIYKEAYNIAMEHYKFCRELIYREIPDFFKNDQYQADHACANIFSMRGAVLEGALEKGYISYADNDERKMLGAYLII